MKKPISLAATAAAVFVSAVLVLVLSGSRVETQGTPGGSAPAAPANSAQPATQPAAAQPVAAQPISGAPRAVVAETRRSLALLNSMPARLESDGARPVRDLLDSIRSQCSLAVLLSPDVALDGSVGAFAATAPQTTMTYALDTFARAADLKWTVHGGTIHLWSSSYSATIRRLTVSYDVVDLLTIMLQREIALRKIESAGKPDPAAKPAPAPAASSSDAGPAAPSDSRGGDGPLTDGVVSRVSSYITNLLGTDTSCTHELGADGLLVLTGTAAQLAEIEDLLADLRTTLGIKK
jgi:hypothetical protein